MGEVTFKVPTSPRFRDLTGCSFGRIKVQNFAYIRVTDGGGQSIYWDCTCNCGNKFLTTSPRLTSGKTRSCGCLRTEVAAKSNTVHGFNRIGKRLPEYNTWSKMTQRCNQINNPDYPNYGGRGIKVCDRWRYSFEGFLADMGRKPSPQHSLDRINNNGNYEPSNCRWATKKEQANNRRPRRKITITIGEEHEFY